MAQDGGELRWGIIGCGVISHDFALSLQASKYPHKIVALAASSHERAECLAQKRLTLPYARYYGEYAKLLADDNVDIVYIGLINNLHLEWTLKAIDAGKHVLCEKPFTCNVKELKQIMEKAKSSNVFIMEAVWTRYFPAWRKAKEIIASKELGELHSFGVNFGMPLAENRFHLDKGQSPLIDIGIYTVSSAMCVFNDKKPDSISIEGHKNKDGVDIWGNITLKWKDGRHACLYYNGATETPTNAYIAFDNGQIEFPHHFWCPEAIDVYKGGKGAPGVEPQRHEWKLSSKTEYNIPHDEGLHYEADHVYEKLQKGEREGDFMPLKSSLVLAEVMEELRTKMGVEYAQD